jgi:hypothetical protein
LTALAALLAGLVTAIGVLALLPRGVLTTLLAAVTLIFLAALLTAALVLATLVLLATLMLLAALVLTTLAPALLLSTVLSALMLLVTILVHESFSYGSRHLRQLADKGVRSGPFPGCDKFAHA